jgi:23S rRNA pseudouridine1911/1915/1917 synthase
MSEAGHPLVGDQLYGTESRLTAIRDTRIRALLKSLSRQALHAKTLGFIHPSSGQYLEFDTDLPEDMQRVLQQMEVQPQNSEGACS